MPFWDCMHVLHGQFSSCFVHCCVPNRTELSCSRYMVRTCSMRFVIIAPLCKPHRIRMDTDIRYLCAYISMDAHIRILCTYFHMYTYARILIWVLSRVLSFLWEAQMWAVKKQVSILVFLAFQRTGEQPLYILKSWESEREDGLTKREHDVRHAIAEACCPSRRERRESLRHCHPSQAVYYGPDAGG